MKQIKYKRENYFYIKTLNYAHIYDITINEFIKLNPPCKECLVKTMCIFTGEYVWEEDRIALKIFVKACKELDKFMKKEKCFKGS